MLEDSEGTEDTSRKPPGRGCVSVLKDEKELGQIIQKGILSGKNHRY